MTEETETGKGIEIEIVIETPSTEKTDTGITGTIGAEAIPTETTVTATATGGIGTLIEMNAGSALALGNARTVLQTEIASATLSRP